MTGGRLAVAVAVVALAGGIYALRAATMSTHTASPPGSRTEVVLDVSIRDAEPAADRDEMAEALVLGCRLEVSAELVGGVRHLGTNRYEFSLTPALDESDRRQLHGCLEDLRIDHLQAGVEHLDNVPAPEAEAG